MSWQARLLNLWLRHVEKPHLARVPTPEKLRHGFERKARILFHAPRGTAARPCRLKAAGTTLEGLSVTPQGAAQDRVILYLHGGGFVFGSPETHAAMVARLAQEVGVRAVLPRYRRAPEYPFPAASQDARAAYDALLAQGYEASQIVVGGDSAGGSLALGLLAELCAERAARPAGVFALSPLTDMTHQGRSFMSNRRVEALLPSDRATDMGRMYLAGHPPEDPCVSPLFADFTGAPPIWLTAGDREILLDDTRAMAERLRSQDVEVSEVIEHDLPHVWPIFHNVLPEARRTLSDLATWIKALPGWQGES